MYLYVERRNFVILIKKLNCLILSFLIVIISVFTVSYKVNAEIIKVGIITEPGENKIGVVLRENPSRKANKLFTLSDGTTVNPTGVTAQDIDGSKNNNGTVYTWYQVQHTSLGVTYTGYIREDMISISEYNADPSFEQQLNAFPHSYREALIKLHAMYPNWNFVADNISISFNQAVAFEDVGSIKLIDGTKLSLRSMRRGCYDWNTNAWISYEDGWHGASTELIAYYMDPRNFLNANDIFMYMKQGYDANSQNLEGIKKILAGTFLDCAVSHTNDAFYNKTYAEVILEAGIQSGVNPYILASTILQEQGTNGATLGKGTSYNGTTVYNFFHWKATGKTDADIINNGAAYAFNNGWTTPSASIIGGAKMYGDKYVKAGQDTYFYKNYNIFPKVDVSHQYAQNVADSYSSAKKLYKMYSNDKDTKLTFRIPVYNGDLPNQVSPYPPNNDSLNNYYFANLIGGNLTPAFDRFNTEYSMTVSADTNIFAEFPNGASLVSGSNYPLKQGDNIVTLTVKAQTGLTKNFIINVHASADCTLTVTGNRDEATVNTVKKGDTNGDGQISLSDLARVRLHLLNKLNFSQTELIGADTNGDGKVSLTDLAAIRLHLLGKKLLS